MPLNCRGAFFFCLIKRSKNQVSKKASLPHRAGRTSGKNHGLHFMLPKAARGLRLSKIAMPLPAHLACLIFPAFGRSLFADGEENGLCRRHKYTVLWPPLHTCARDLKNEF
jgi:hypothetical protein